MKRLLLAFLIVQILSGETKGQEISISGVSPESFSGVRSINNGEQYYIAFMDATAPDSGNVALRVFDRGMQLRREINIPVAKGMQLAASVFTGQFYVLQLVNAGNKTRSTIVVDEGGNVFRRKDETDIKASVLSPASFPTFYPISPNDYLVVRTSRDGKPVLEFELMDMEFNSRWQKAFESNNGSEVLELKTEMDRVFLVRKENAGPREAFNIQVLSGMSGDDFFSTELKEGENIGVPGFFDVQQGFITTAGIFQRESAPGKSEGLFFVRLDPSGKPEKMQFTPWTIIKTQVKSNVIADLETGKTGVQIQNVIPDLNNEGVTLIGELYKKTAGAEANTATFSVQDFILVHFNKEGQADKVSQISKPARDVLVKGTLSARPAAELAQWLDKNQFFGYRATVPAGGKTVITYLDKTKDKATGYFAAFDSTGAAPAQNIVALDLDRRSLEGSKEKQKDKSTDIDVTVLNSTEKDLRDFATARRAKDIIFAQEGNVLISNLTDPDLRIWLMPVPVRQ